ncbi:HNH endonuclease [Cupriavidus metallidurans]|uniref:HNH endonuclease n=1 Tax=Cupriavidus metallidurans TaxID=119219 RepID=UPI001319EB63|nr:HNH endonuclease signature motif containing protein [Cupriavidus metallidurans]
MPHPRDPETLQALTREHLLAAAQAWDPARKVSDFEMEAERTVTIDGRSFPTKPIVALAHALAGFGTLTSAGLAGWAARRRLTALELPVSPPIPRKKPAASQASRAHLSQWALEREDLEAGAIAMRAQSGPIPNRLISLRPHQTEWRLEIDGLWYNPYRLAQFACAAAGLTFDSTMGVSDYRRFQTFLGTRFPLKRGRTPSRAPGQPWASTELREAAAGLLGTDAQAAGADDGGESLQVVLDGIAYPAASLLGLAPGQALSTQDLAAITEAGGTLRAAPDPVDAALEALAAQQGLPTEVSRQVRGRIGQGRFRDALLQLHGRCAVSGISNPAVLRAAHIHRWADCDDTPTARHDVDNGLLLAAHLDALFEKGLIIFADDGRMLVSPELTPADRELLQIAGPRRLAVKPSLRQCEYLAEHRARIAREGMSGHE